MNGDQDGDGARDLVLDGKHVRHMTVVALRPAVGAADRVDQLRRHAQSFAVAADAALDHVANAQLLADPAHVDRTALVLERGVACDHDQAGEPRQLSDDVVGDAVAEILLAWITGDVLERQDGDRRPVVLR